MSDRADISRAGLTRMIDVLVDVIREHGEMQTALTLLVDAKDEKELNGETARYLELRRDGWERARKALGR